MNALPYFLNASLYLALFYGCYWLLLRRNTFFNLNRLYLLASVGLSLLLPLVDLSAWWSVETRNAVDPITLPAFVVGSQATTPTSGLSANHWFWLVYGLGVAVMSIRLVLNLRAVIHLIRQGNRTKQSTYILIRLLNDATPSFSFGWFLVLNQTDARLQPEALLRHEQAHIRQYHTADVFFLELVRIAFWFNPMLWLYKQALQEVHEFLADRAALRTPQPDYAQQLVAYALHVSPTALITPYVSVSTLKQRIVMLQKPQSGSQTLLGYALVLPLAGLLTLCTQPDREVAQTEHPAIINQNQPARQAGVDGEIFTVVENQPEFPGGMKKLGEFLVQNLRYPAAAQKANVQGRVFVSFIVTKEGDIVDPKILKDVGFGTGEEAVRVLKAMPRWEPATQSGQVVNVRYNLPINFQIDDAEWESAATNAKKSAFFAVPTNDADLQKQYKHFIVDGKEVSFDEFKKQDKSAIVEASSSQQTIWMQTTPPPPPPPPVPANDASVLKAMKRITINGKQATKEEAMALRPNKIIRANVNWQQGTLALTTK